MADRWHSVSPACKPVAGGDRPSRDFCITKCSGYYALAVCHTSWLTEWLRMSFSLPRSNQDLCVTKSRFIKGLNIATTTTTITTTSSYTTKTTTAITSAKNHNDYTTTNNNRNVNNIINNYTTTNNNTTSTTSSTTITRPQTITETSTTSSTTTTRPQTTIALTSAYF